MCMCVYVQIEKKLLRSARTLLQVSQDGVKREKLKASIATHETSVKNLKHQIRELKGQLLSLGQTMPAYCCCSCFLLLFVVVGVECFSFMLTLGEC